MDALRSAGAAWPGAVAVSGGGDSIALMLLLAAYAKHAKLPPPVVLTVDHGLRPDSAKDAKAVLRMAGDAGLKAHVLTWKGAAPKSDIEAEARAARYRLMGEWLVAHEISGLYVAHTMEDQAETFLLRLARGSGLDGLSAMRVIAPYPMQGFAGLMVVRPLLDMARIPLRDFLRAKKQAWIEDPMNGDPRFARSKLRAAWPQLEALGLTAQRVSDAADHLGRAREALDDMTAALLERAARFDDGGALVDSVRLKMAPREVGLRALAAALSRVSGEIYRPRFGKLERLFDTIRDGSLGGGATLHGCIVAPAPRAAFAFGTGTLIVRREPGRAGSEKSIAAAPYAPKIAANPEKPVKSGARINRAS
ncbi:MAG: tRNA lysidine(34) synthetase TilS [Proteobacteria bacterium]|nr:tRNA lysidine(34) synthetase TilS [Pseudomonadota bacterium]